MYSDCKMSNVKLAIRVRPFTDRELKSDKDRVSVVNVADDHTVTITNMKVSASGAGDSRERTRRYFADYTFDSSCLPTLPGYASQEKVFESIGREVLSSISVGQSACVMAYGQSATGKTHTMAGSETQPGLVPRLCRELAATTGATLVTVSFLEIYNERVHDLLVGEAAPTCHSLPRRRGNARKDLRVREHPTKGPYVQNLRRVAVHDVDSLLALVSEGTRRRRTAATRRNNTSSRSHALLELATHNATLHLADLAGSEKASWEGCGGGRQKEGANINKSLVALSNVISALVSCGSGRNRFVPYRDSALTWLLKDCFTGGASTFIIATVSPSFACYGESASTLRWAERARQLPTPKNIDLGSNTTTKAVLLAQFNQLISELARNFIIYIPETGKISYDEHHWNLQTNTNSLFNALKPEANIGNIMNLARPKPDANSESTASSVASGSSDVINTIDKNIKIVDEINKEVDKLFVPSLERTSSSTDLKVVAPLRHKRRQYKSQEVLQLDETLTPSTAPATSLSSPNSTQLNEQSQKPKPPNITILHDSQRAEIVASVTERLYTKLKKKEEAAASKVEAVVEKKIMEPLNELRICTNARQRLMELSQKAIRNKRRIGIPAFTQTRKAVIRVKDQAIDVQTDLESYIVKTKTPNSYAFHRDVATETAPMTPRCKEIAVGSKYGTLNLSDSSTSTDNKKIIFRNSCVMTDKLVKCERQTQTPVVPPPRRKKRALNIAKYLHNEAKNPEENMASLISINISQTYSADTESQSSDDNANTSDEVDKPTLDLMTPDLLTNHCDVNPVSDSKVHDICIEVNTPQIKNCSYMSNSTDSLESAKQSEEFPDTDDCSLPRVSIDSLQKNNQLEIKNIILGRNENLYPYNIILSPPKERDTKRIVTFKDIDIAHAINVASQTDWESNKDENINNQDNKHTNGQATNVDITVEDDEKDANETTYSDSTDSSKLETDSFIWKDGNDANRTLGSLRRTNYIPVYKGSERAKTMRAKFYRDFLGLDNDESAYTNSLTDEFGNNDSSSDNAQAFSSYRSRPRSTSNDFSRKRNEKVKDSFQDVHRKINESCNDLERTVNNYEQYLSNYRSKPRGDRRYTSRSPSAHLQHLVRLRREVVKADIDTTD